MISTSLIGQKSNAASSDLSTILPEEVEDELKKAAEISMGTDVCFFSFCILFKILSVPLILWKNYFSEQFLLQWVTFHGIALYFVFYLSTTLVTCHFLSFIHIEVMESWPFV